MAKKPSMKRSSASGARALAAFCCFYLISISDANAAGNALFRLAPKEAVLVANGAVLVKEAADNGAFLVNFHAGSKIITVMAPGFEARRVAFPEPVPGVKVPVIEVKLERIDTELRLERIVRVSKRPKSVEFTPDGKYLIVAPLSDRRIDILDAADGSLAASPAIPGDYEKFTGYVESAFPPGRDELWVSQMYTDSVHVFSLVDFTWKKTFASGGTFPKVLCPHPDGRVFVSNWVSQTVSALDGASGSRLASYRANGTPRGLALSADGTSLYVANFDNGSIEVLDARSMKRIGVLFNGKDGLPAGGAKRHLVVDPVFNRLYASDMTRGSVFVLDLKTNRMLAEIKVGDKTNTIKVSPDGSWIYVSTRGPNHAVNYELKGPAFGEFIVIDARKLEVSERHWGGNQPTGLAVSPDGRRIVFTDFLDHRIEIYSRSQ